MRRLAVTAVCLSLAACPRRPLSFGPRGELTDPAPLLEALHARSVKLEVLSAEASVSGESDRGGGSTSALIAAARPASLKLELDDFFGNPAAVLTTDGTLLGIYTAQTGIYGEGLATKQSLSRLVPVEVPLGEAVDVLFGDPRPLSTTVAGFMIDRVAHTYVLMFEGTGRHQRIDLDTESWLPTKVRFEGSEPYEARFWDPMGELKVPKHLEVEAPTGKFSVRYDKIELNPVLDAEFFKPVAPPRAKKMQLGE